MSLRSRLAGGLAATLAAALVAGCSADGRSVDGSSVVIEQTPGDDAEKVADCAPAPLRQRAAAALMVGLPEVTSADDPLVE